MPSVKFIKVGRNEACWEADCKGELTREWLYGQVKKHLLSKDIQFGFNGKEGAIYTGIRTAGRFELKVVI